MSGIIEATEFVAQANAAGVDVVNGLVVNATLRHEEHLRYDDRLLMIARQRLNGIADLQRMGLVVPLGGIGVMLSIYERAGDMTAAAVNMDGVTMSQKDRLTFDEVGVPIPIFHKDWSLNKRQLEASRTRGEPLSVSQVGIATRIVADSLEDCLFNGVPNFIVDGKQIYGYTNHPNRNTVTLAGSGWGTATGRDIIGDMKNMLDAAYADNKFGPFCLYVAKDIWADIQMDYSTEKGDKTFKERIEAFADISEVKAGDSLAAGNVVLVQLTEDVVDLAVAQDVVNLEWSNNPMQTLFKVYGAMAPRVKADKNGSCGIVHGSV